MRGYRVREREWKQQPLPLSCPFEGKQRQNGFIYSFWVFVLTLKRVCLVAFSTELKLCSSLKIICISFVA